MKMYPHTTNRLSALAAAAIMLHATANAATISVSQTYGFTTSGLSTLTDLSGTSTGAGAGYDAADPTTWNENGAGFEDTSFDNPLSGATNSKLGWYAFDLGSSQALDTIYVMNGWYLFGSESLSADQFNVYYATTPTVALSSGGDYDFSSGGWIQLGGLVTMGDGQDTAEAISASGVTARYVGIELMRDHTTSDIRIGLNEVAFTAIPEPSAALLGSLGGLLLLRRRRG